MLQTTTKPARVQIDNTTIPTYGVTPRSMLPPLFDEEVTYPYEGYIRTDRTPAPRTYRTITIENDLLRVTVLPEMGGRILQIEDMMTGGKYLHENDVVRPVRIPPCWAWVSLGIELNFPVTHSPTGNLPVGYELITRDDGSAGVAVGEREMMWGLCWRAEICLHPGFRGVSISVRAWNPTRDAREVQWWSNAEQPAGGDTEFVYPYEHVLAHIHGASDGDWPLVGGNDLRQHINYDTMCGLFWEPTKEDWFGIYHHERAWGLLHLADPSALPGKKLWSFGHTGDTADWTLAMTRGASRCCEIQSGIPTTQENRLTMNPGDELSFVEFWLPVDRREELDAPKRPTYAQICESLGGIESLLAPREEIDSPSGAFWKDLVAAYAMRDESFLRTHDTRLAVIWPPTGLELEGALRWARAVCGGLWTYQLGVLLCATMKYDEASEMFVECLGTHPNFRPAAFLLSLIQWKVEEDPARAWETMRTFLDESADPQILAHADALLRELGLISERKRILAFWDDEDFRKHETAIQIALDEGRAADALAMLEGHKWERHHCRYRRSILWQEARAALGMATEPVPMSLKEDAYQVER